MLHRTNRIRLLMLFCVLVLLASCAPVAPTGADATTQAVTLTVAVQSGHTGASAAADKVSEFEAATGIGVNIVEIPERELTQKMLLEFAGETGAYDALMAPEDAFAVYVTNGYLASLDEAGGAPDDLDDFIPRFLDRVRYEDQLYGLPLSGDINVLYYNAELFEQAGLDPDSPPQDWEQFRAYAQQLTRDEVYGTAWLGVQGDASTWAWATYLFSFGGDFFDEADSPIFNSQAGVDALQYIVDAIHTDQVMPPSVPNWDYDQINAAFPQGRVAMVINWPYMLGLVNDPEQSQVVGQVRIALAPKGEVYGVPAGGWKWLIAKDSQHKAEALQFIDYMTSADFQIYMVEQYNQLPTRSSVYAEMQTRYPDDYTWQVWEDAFSEAARFMPVQYPEWPQISSIISLALQQAQILELTPQEALDTAAEQVQQLLEGAGYYD